MEIPTGQDWNLDMINNILIEVLSSIAEQERIKIHDRQKEGIEAMRIVKGKRVSLKTGNPIGRPAVSFPDNWELYFKQWKAGTITAKKFMDDLQLKRTTFYKLIKKYESHNC